MFSCEYCEFLRTAIFIEHLSWLLLFIQCFPVFCDTSVSIYSYVFCFISYLDSILKKTPATKLCDSFQTISYNCFVSPYDLTGMQIYLKRDWHRCFLVNFAKFLTTHFLKNTSVPASVDKKL